MKIPPAGKILAKTVGAAALGLVGYDAYKRGQWQSKTDYKNTAANMMISVSEDAQLLDQNSATRGAAKNKFHRWFINSNIGPFYSHFTGFLKGIGSSILDNAIPFALATGAVCFKKCDKLCAIGLGLYAAKYFITEMLGFGKPHYISSSPY